MANQQESDRKALKDFDQGSNEPKGITRLLQLGWIEKNPHAEDSEFRISELGLYHLGN